MDRYYTVTVHTEPQYEEQIAQVLDLVAPGSYVYEYDAQSQTDKFVIYTDSEEQEHRVQQTLLPLLSQVSEDITLELSSGEHADWQNEWKKFFEPLLIGKRLAILPAWEETDIPDRAAIVRIDPGMAFGTGGHATTKGCLIFLEKIIRPGMSVLDFGTGSGILAIAACKLGAAPIDAIDNDPEAVNVARENSRVNSCASAINFYTGGAEAVPARTYEVIVANITADVIIANFEQLVAGQEKLAFMILSGISDLRKPDLDRYLEQRGLQSQETFNENGWHSYLLNMKRQK